MVLEILGTAALEWLVGKVAEKALNGVNSQLTVDDLKKAIKAGIENANNQVQLFSPSEQGIIRNFLHKVFQEAGLEELQKPFKEGKPPDVDNLVAYFKKELSENKKLKERVELSKLKPWMTVFINTYFQETDTFLKLEVAKDKYLKQLIIWFEKVQFAGIAVSGQETEKSEKLENIFVMPDVLDCPYENGSISLNLGININNKLNQGQENSRLFSAKKLLSQNSSLKIVLLGEPGSGKTTLISYFAVKLAQKRNTDLGLNTETDWLPVVIKIRDLAKQQQIDLIEYMQSSVQRKSSTLNLPNGFFEYYLKQGQVLLLLDGLDEIADLNKSKEIVNFIDDFLKDDAFAKNRAIITSRPAGYRLDSFRTEGLSHYCIQPFDRDKINLFINQWHKSRFPDAEDAKRWEQSLKDVIEGQGRIKLLARNPLLLTTIALIHRYETYRLPQRRHNLYDKAVETLLMTWVMNKDTDITLKLDYLKQDDLRRLMERIAYWVHARGSKGNQDGGTVVERDELIEQLTKEIQALKSIEYYKAENEAERFLVHIRERTGLLNEQGQDCYAFVHKTFQEYLCAQEIDYQYKNEGDFDILREHIEQYLYDPHWEEVLILLIVQQKPKQIAKAVKAILNCPNAQPELPYHNLFFACRCLAEDPKDMNTVGKEDPSAEIINTLVDLEVRDSSQVSDKIKCNVFTALCSLKGTNFEALALQSLESKKDRINSERSQQYQIAFTQAKINHDSHPTTTT